MHELSFIFSCFLLRFSPYLGMNSFHSFSKFVLFKVIFAKLSLDFTKTETNDVSKELLEWFGCQRCLNKEDRSDMRWTLDCRGTKWNVRALD